jgi:TonB family protein
MAPIAKDVENSTATSIPAAPSTTATKSPAEAPTRPQPVPLEVPVSVNGARTIEGTDKREPFSESTKTVLVFANGAVIRLAAGVTPGQLLFVTNEKSKKEVVCQVVKSKNYRTVTGYVELEFTEPAAGFWGIRIPAETAAAPVGAPKAPAARPVTPTAAQIATLPKPAAPIHAAPVAPVAPKTNIAAPPVVPAPLKPVAVAPPVLPTAQPVAPVSVAKPEVVHTPAPVQAHTEVKVEEKAPVHAEAKPQPQPVAPPQPIAVKQEALPVQLADQLSSLLGTAVGSPNSAPAHPVTPPASDAATTDELRQQAARLQEQLSSLLFRQEAAEKKQNSAPAPTVIESKKEEKAVEPAAVHVAPVSQVAPTPAAPVFEAKSVFPPAPEPTLSSTPVIAPIPEFKATPVAPKPVPLGLQVEEVKIPSWLAPLARETESATEAGAATDASSGTFGETDAAHSANNFSAHAGEEGASSGQSVVFGGQLLGGGAATSETSAASSGSKTGLFVGLVAAALLAIGGGVWYGMQPGNFLSGKPGGAAVAVSSAAATNVPTSAAETNNAASASNSAPTTSAPPAAVNSRNTASATPAVSSPAADAARSSGAAPASPTKSLNSALRTAPPVEEPKKSVMGDVHLATPNVTRGEGGNSNVAAPTIDSADATLGGDPLAGIAGSNRAQPKAPLPIGGDVKPAVLVKSTPPTYPPVARTQRIAGNVQLDALIDVNGNVTSAKVISGPVLLHQAAVNAVKSWKYAPAQLDGKPTATHLAVTVEFRIQ